jgi:hypothetical protein
MPGIKKIMAEMWRRSVQNELELHEYSITVVRNTKTGKLRVISEQGSPIRPGEPARTIICGPSVALQEDEVGWGTIHTHPLPPSEGMEEPNLFDKATVAKILSNGQESLRCGAEHYVISRNKVYVYDGSTYNEVGGRKEIIGE